MARIEKIRLDNGDVVTPGDWTTAEPLWSTVEIASGNFTVQSAFSYGINGSVVPGSINNRKPNEADTNLRGEGGRLPEDEELIIYNIAVEMFAVGGPGDAQADALPQSDPPDVSVLNLLRMQAFLLTELRISTVNKVYIQAPVGYFPASTGVLHYNSGQRTSISFGTLGTVSANNGSHNAGDVRLLASANRVKGGETFAIDFKPGPGAITGLNVNNDATGAEGRIRLRVFLAGYRRRPVA